MNILQSRTHISGFSLIEIITSFFVFMLISLAIWTFQKDVYFFNSFISDRLASQHEAQTFFKIISSEIRSMSASSTGTYPISEAGNNSFVFYSDIDNDSLKERLRYFVENGTLKRGIIKPASYPLTYNPTSEEITDIIHYVRNDAEPLFIYYDSSYDGTTAPLLQPINILSVRLIKINVFIDKDPNRPPAPIIMTTQISIRNLKDNL